VFTGAKADITSDGDRIPQNHPVFCREGQILRIGAFQKGAILYLGISGGFYQKKIANSASPLVAGSHSRLRPGTMLLGQERKTAPRLYSHISTPEISMDVALSAMEGPEYSWLSDQHKEHLFDQTFTVSTRADRMGFLLSGMSIYRSTKQEMRTSAVMPGVVQCLPDGQLLVLMRDCQTTGGYPRILVLDELSLNQLAQRAPGNLVKFQKK
jgi:allophanate hydrolase subunit 2